MCGEPVNSALLKKSFWKNIHFWGMVVWCVVNMEDHLIFWIIHSPKNFFSFYSVPQTAAPTFAFSSVFFFFFYGTRSIPPPVCTQNWFNVNRLYCVSIVVHVWWLSGTTACWPAICTSAAQTPASGSSDGSGYIRSALYMGSEATCLLVPKDQTWTGP